MIKSFQLIPQYWSFTFIFNPYLCDILLFLILVFHCYDLLTLKDERKHSSFDVLVPLTLQKHSHFRSFFFYQSGRVKVFNMKTVRFPEP